MHESGSNVDVWTRDPGSGDPPIASAATEIVYWDFIKPGDGTPRGNMLTKHLERFHAKYPNIRVKVEVVPPPMIDPNLIQGAAGSTPDIVRVDTHYLSRHVSAGSIQPLDKFADKAGKCKASGPAASEFTYNSTVDSPAAGKSCTRASQSRAICLRGDG